MFKSLTIKNFKSHKDSKILLTSGVNSIFGDSDSGKSAIMKALYWCIHNQPSGDSFINNPKIPTIVAIELDNGVIIEREKYKSVNKYAIINGKDRQEFKSFNQGVPNEVKELLKFKSFNFQLQFDDHFLLSNNSGEVARFFNDVIDLDVIDSTFENILKDDFRIKAEIKRLKNTLEEINKESECFEWIDSADDELSKIEKIDNKISIIEPKISFIESKIEEIKETEIKFLKYKNLQEMEMDMVGISILTEKIPLIKSKAISLKNKITEIKEIEINLSKYKKLSLMEKDILEISNISEKIIPIKKNLTLIKNIISEIKRIENIKSSLNLDDIEREYNVVVKLNQSVINARINQFSLLSIINKIKDSELELSKIKSKIKNLETKFCEIMPDICPLCGNEAK